jgi:protein phosphatase
VRREEFGDQVKEHPDLPSLCSALIDLANERGGPDNITVVAAHFTGPGLRVASDAEGVGYQVFDLPESEVEETDEIPVAASEPVAAVEPPGPEPTFLGSRLRGVLLIIAVICLLAAALAFWL